MGNAEIVGLENKVSIDWLASFNQSLSATLLKTEDLRQSKSLARRPDLSIKNNLTYLLKERHYLGYELSYTGKRDDVDNFGNTVKMEHYLLSNFNYRYLVNAQNEFYLKIKKI